MKYALQPPSEKEISQLVDYVAEELKRQDDVALQTLAKAIADNKHKDGRQTLITLVASLIEILTKTYPSLVLQYDREIFDSEKKENEKSD